MDAKYQKKQMKRKYKSLFQEISSVIFKHDPIGINVGDNPGEYDLETSEILAHLQHCDSEKGLDKAIHSIFTKTFSARSAGVIRAYKNIAHDIWVVWEKEQNKSN